MASFQLADLFEGIADAVPDRMALVCGDKRRTYAELDQRATQLANAMKAKGIGKGDHVGIYLYNSAEYIEATIACFKVRAVPINVNYRYVEDELVYIFDNADLKATVFGREFTTRINNIKGNCPKLELCIAVEDGTDEDISTIGAIEFEELLATGATERDFDERAGDDLYILYTGGTTGMPKGVMWPHENLFFRALLGGDPGGMHGGPVKTPEELVERAVNGFELVTMPTAPLMHGACQWSCFIALFGGQKVVLTSSRSFDANHIWQLVEEEKINTLSFVGDAMARPLLDALKENKDRDLSSIFALGSGGAVFSQSLQDEFKETFPNAMLINSFGSSETGYGGTSDDSKDDGLGSIELGEHRAVIADDHTFVKAGDGRKGILSLKSNTPIGYYKDEKKTAETFIKIDGETWVLSGDIAEIREDGSVIVFGRGSGCINTGGEKVFPEEVEVALKAHPSIFDTLVVGVPDERFTNRVATIIQLREGHSLSIDEMKEHCKTKISGYKVPREMHLTAEIKRQPSGKPDYKWAKTFAESGDGKVEA